MTISLKNLGKHYGELTVFRNIDVTIDDGEFVSIVGPSGCGKSTLLNIIAGTTDADTGSLEFSNGSEEVSYVFQTPRLLDWRTVRQNLHIVLEPTPIPESEYDVLISEFLEMTNLEEITEHYPRELSGGMQSRVGLIRGLIVPANTILMDEPLGDIDELTARKIRDELLEIWRQSAEKKTIVYVTHNVFEAVYLSDRILVMDEKPTESLEEVRIDVDRPRDPQDEELFRFQNLVYEALPE